MYSDGRPQRKRKPFFALFLLIACTLAVIGGGLWYYYVRGDDLQITSVNGEKAIGNIQTAPTKEFKTDLYRIDLPESWVAVGRKNPVSDSVYYEYQNTSKNYDNRYLRIYVDVYPPDFPLNHLLPVTVVNDRIVPAVVSEDCSTFSAPSGLKPTDPKPDFITAKWQGVTFTCDLKQFDRKIGTASAEEKYGITIPSKSGAKHKYFFVYIDRNVRTDFQLLPNVVKSFRTL